MPQQAEDPPEDADQDEDSPDADTPGDADAPPAGMVPGSEVEHPADSTLISILLTSALSWSWLLAQSDASAQVFAYMPQLIAEALDIDRSQVTTDSLEAWEPPGWQGAGADM